MIYRVEMGFHSERFVEGVKNKAKQSNFYSEDMSIEIAMIRNKSEIPQFLPGIQELLNVTNQVKAWEPAAKRPAAAATGAAAITNSDGTVSENKAATGSATTAPTEAEEDDSEEEGLQVKRRRVVLPPPSKPKVQAKLVALDDEEDEEMETPGARKRGGCRIRRGGLAGRGRGGRGTRR